MYRITVFSLIAVCMLGGVVSAQLSITEDVLEGKECFRIETPWATLYYEDHNGSSGFKGVFDNEGIDWLQAGYGWGRNPGYRGFPNATDSDFGHAQRNSSSTNTITKQGYNHIVINSSTDLMEFNYHFFSSHGAIEVIRAEEKYCFLWEGTNGGSVEDEDYFVTADGETMYAGNEKNRINDFPEEWMYFGDPNRSSIFLHGKRPDDNIKDENWRRGNTFELYSFGRGDPRDGWKRRLEGTDNYYVFTFLDANTSHDEITDIINRLFEYPYRPLDADPDTGVTIKQSATRLPINGSLSLSSVKFPEEGAVTWNATGGATVLGTDNTSATLTAPAVEGEIQVIASFMGINDTLTLEVYDPAKVHLKINAGGPRIDDWEAGVVYIDDGDDYSFSFTPDVSKVTDPAPAEIYKTVHHYDHQYDIELADGNYLVRIHFINNADGRFMNYTIEGQTVLENYTVTEDAGGTGIAVIREFNVTVADGNGLQIEARKGSGNDVFECGVEVIAREGGTQARPVFIGAATPVVSAVQRVGNRLSVRLNRVDNEPVQLMSLNGKVLASQRAVNGKAYLPAPPAGAYLLSAGSHAIEKIHVR